MLSLTNSIPLIDYRPLDEWRKYYGIDYKDMASEVGVQPAALSYYRTAGRPFPADWIVLWSKVYNLAPDETYSFFLKPLKEAANA